MMEEEKNNLLIPCNLFCFFFCFKKPLVVSHSRVPNSRVPPRDFGLPGPESQVLGFCLQASRVTGPTFQVCTINNSEKRLVCRIMEL